MLRCGGGLPVVEEVVLEVVPVGNVPHKLVPDHHPSNFNSLGSGGSKATGDNQGDAFRADETGGEEALQVLPVADWQGEAEEDYKFGDRRGLLQAGAHAIHDKGLGLGLGKRGGRRGAGGGGNGGGRGRGGRARSSLA